MVLSLGLLTYALSPLPRARVGFTTCNYDCEPVGTDFAPCLGDPKEQEGLGHYLDLNPDVCTPIRRTTSFQACLTGRCPGRSIEVLTLYETSNCTGQVLQQRGVGGPTVPCRDFAPTSRSVKLTCEEARRGEILEGANERRAQRCGYPYSYET